jgi:Ca-activated chloride channel family protein
VHLSALLDVDLVAVEQTDELTLLVELTAPTPTRSAKRQPATAVFVTDTSGSMRGGRLDVAKGALLDLVDRLDPADNFGVVAFDSSVRTVVPAGPLVDKAGAKQAIAALEPGGSTDLSAGYFRGLQEAVRVLGPTGATVLVLSDGRATHGVKDPGLLSDVAAKHRSGGIVTAVLGLGLGYDETLLSALAHGGGGHEHFAEEADTAGELLAGEVDGLLDQVAQAASLRITWGPYVTGIDVLNDLTVASLPSGAQVELGSFYAGETRRLLLTLKVPGIPALGLVQVAMLEFTSVALPELVMHTTTVPVHVNVVPGDQAAGRIADMKVRSEALFQRTQRDKRQAGRLLSEGRAGEASGFLYGRSAQLRSEARHLPPSTAGDLFAEAALLGSLADEAGVDRARAAKVMSYDTTSKTRFRGRQMRGGRLRLSSVDGAPELVLEEWERQRLLRGLPADLAALLRPATGPRDAASAQSLADALGAEHPAHAFFTTAAGGGGFRVERA